MAIAITAYSRILMSEVKNIPGLIIYYTDSDSIYIDDYLPEELVDSKKLGMWKLEDD